MSDSGVGGADTHYSPSRWSSEAGMGHMSAVGGELELVWVVVWVRAEGVPPASPVRVCGWRCSLPASLRGADGSETAGTALTSRNHTACSSGDG